MPNRLLTPEEQRHAFDRAEDRWKEDGRKDVWEFSTLWEYIADEVRKAQDAKTHEIDCQKFGEWLESKMFAVPLMGVEWHIRLDHIEALKRGEMPE